MKVFYLRLLTESPLNSSLFRVFGPTPQLYHHVLVIMEQCSYAMMKDQLQYQYIHKFRNTMCNRSWYSGGFTNLYDHVESICPFPPH